MIKVQRLRLLKLNIATAIAFSCAFCLLPVFAGDGVSRALYSREPGLDTVRKIMRDKNYSAAKPLLDDYLKKNPNSSLALVYRSHCYADENKTKEALDCLYRAAKADPTNPEVYAEEANIYAMQKQHQKAIDAATLSIKHGKGHSVKHMYHLRSMMLSAQGKYKQAIEDMNSYLKIDSVKDRAFMWRATSYEQDGQLDKALADYRTAMQMSKNYEYRFHTARVLQKQGKMEEAVAEMTAIIRQNPEEDEAWNKRGTLHFAMGKYRESVKDFTQALATSFGSNETIYRARGRAYEKLGQRELALKDFRKAEELQKKPTVAPI